MLSTLEKLQTFDATKTIEFTPLGLNPSAALFHWSLPAGTYSLSAGEYFVQVSYNASVGIDYNLNVKVVDPGSTISNAFSIPTPGTFSKNTKVSDWLSSYDIGDVYRFSVDNTSRVGIDIDGYGNSSAHMRLIRDKNNNGSIDTGEEVPLDLTSSPPSSSQDKLVGSNKISWRSGTYNYLLQPGEYFVQVSYDASGGTTYNLNMSVK